MVVHFRPGSFDQHILHLSFGALMAVNGDMKYLDFTTVMVTVARIIKIFTVQLHVP
jgi:hypothetical protein